VKWIAVTQRVEQFPSYNERRDALDQRWCQFLEACGYVPLLLPSCCADPVALIDAVSVSGILLTGGNSLQAYGGHAPERDALERSLLSSALERRIPLIGVCRGMQVIQDYFGVPLERVAGHIAIKQEVVVQGRVEFVNSYHEWGAQQTVPFLKPWAVAADGVIEAVSHQEAPIHGIMWHPERFEVFRQWDLEWFRSVFG